MENKENQIVLDEEFQRKQIETAMPLLPEVVKSPALAMLEAAINSGKEPEQLLKFYDLYERHEANEARKAYVSSMAKFRGLCPSIVRTKKSYNSNYAGLAETLDVITKTMSDCGLTHSWETIQEGAKIGVTCWLTHELGHKEKTTLYAGADESGKKTPIQAIASTVSYLQRYTLFAILGLASREMDNDGAEQKNEVIDAKTLAEIELKLKTLKINVDKFKKHFSVDELKDIQLTQLKSIYDTFKNKEKVIKSNENI